MAQVITGSGKVAVVIGSGAVGAFAAIKLAEQGWIVKVFDTSPLPGKRPHPLDERAYTLALTLRALKAFTVAGIELKTLAAPHAGTLAMEFYSPSGQLLPKSSTISTEGDPVCLRVFRDEVSRHVIDEAQRLHRDAITFHFNAHIQHMNLQQHSVHAQLHEGQPPQLVHYDLLVGADGVNSIVRSALQQILPPTFLWRYRHSQMYCTTAVVLEDPNSVPGYCFFQVHNFKDGTVLWDGREAGNTRVGLMLPQHHADAVRGGRAQQLMAYIKDRIPALPLPARKAAVDLIKRRPTFYPIPSWMYLSQMHGPQTVLLGDSAHIMSPDMGQGLNAGLEDVAVFADVLKQHSGNVSSGLPAFSRARLPDIHALTLINQIVSSDELQIVSQDQGMSLKLWLFGHKLLLILHMVSHTLLKKASPKVFAGPHMMPFVLGTEPYRALTQAMYKDGLALVALLTMAVAVACRLL